MALESNEYKCAMCHGVFVKGWSDEDANQEFEQQFGSPPSSDQTSLVCDDCYKEIQQWLAQQKQ